MSKKEVTAAIWLTNAPLPSEVCLDQPILERYGFYRKLNDGKLEFISFCNPESKNWLSMHKKDFNEMMNRADIELEE